MATSPSTSPSAYSLLPTTDTPNVEQQAQTTLKDIQKRGFFTSAWRQKKYPGTFWGKWVASLSAIWILVAGVMVKLGGVRWMLQDSEDKWVYIGEWAVLAFGGLNAITLLLACGRRGWVCKPWMIAASAKLVLLLYIIFLFFFTPSAPIGEKMISACIKGLKGSVVLLPSGETQELSQDALRSLCKQRLGGDLPSGAGVVLAILLGWCGVMAELVHFMGACAGVAGAPPRHLLDRSRKDEEESAEL